MNIFLYYFLSITFRLIHILPGAQVWWGIIFYPQYVCVCVCELETVVCGVCCVINIHFSEFKGQATEKYTILIWASELNPATELH